jgi:RNase P protein component
MKLSRLSGRKVNDSLRRKGNVWKGKTMTIRWLPVAPRNPNIDPESPGLYTGTGASIKLHKSAVKRNRMRRRCREALRVHIKDMKKLPTMQLLITPKIASLTCDYQEIKKDISTFLTSTL